MTPEGRRAARRLAFTAISAAAGYAVAGASARQVLRVPLAVLITAAVGNLGVQVKTASKTYAVESRFNNLISNGGSFGGNIVVNGNHTVTGTAQMQGDAHVAGSLFGTGGTLTAGDAVHINGNPLTADGTITSHADINATTGTITGGTVNSNADIHATSGTVHAGGVASSGNVTASGAFVGGSTTGVSTQGSVTPDAFGGGFGGGSGLNATAQADLNALANAHNDLVTDVQACVNRVNDFISALG